jgi:GT2 family glycosyltransferase
MDKISLSIVLYNNKGNQLKQLFQSIECVNNKNIKIYIIDNSPISIHSRLPQIKIELDYNFFPENLGYGSGHNFGIAKALKENYRYHVVLNPDIYFKEDVITPMITWMSHNDNIGLMMPQVLNPDSSIQFLPKLLPSPIDLLLRKFNLNLVNYELKNIEQSIIYNTPILSGCFTLINLELVKRIGFYDDKYFLYFEDWDFSRRVHLKYKTIYFPKVSIFHAYQSNANKKLNHFLYFFRSAIRYFNKWGWFFDTQRSIININTKNQFLK